MYIYICIYLFINIHVSVIKKNVCRFGKEKRPDVYCFIQPFPASILPDMYSKQNNADETVLSQETASNVG